MIYLNKYDWKLNIVILTKYSNIEEILNYYLIPEKYKQKALTRLTQFYNSGIIYNDEYNKRSIIVIGECDSLFDLVNVFEHEKIIQNYFYALYLTLTLIQKKHQY